MLIAMRLRAFRAVSFTLPADALQRQSAIGKSPFANLRSPGSRKNFKLKVSDVMLSGLAELRISSAKRDCQVGLGKACGEPLFIRLVAINP